MIYNPDEIEDPSWLLGLLSRKEKEKINMPNHARNRCRSLWGGRNFSFHLGGEKKGTTFRQLGHGKHGR